MNFTRIMMNIAKNNTFMAISSHTNSWDLIRKTRDCPPLENKQPY